MTAIAMALTMTAAAVSPVMAAETAQDNGTEIIAEDIADEESVGEGIVGPLYQEDCRGTAGVGGHGCRGDRDRRY